MEHPTIVSQDSSANLKSFYSLFDEVPFMVAAFKGPSLFIEYVNKFTLQFWQLNREDVIGRPLAQVRPDIQKHTLTIHEEVYRTGKRFQVNEAPLNITTNGIIETRYFNAVIDPMFNHAGEVIGQLATTIEVTEQVLARKKSEDSELLFRTALDGAEMGTFDFDPQTGKLEWSAKTKEHFGLPPHAEINYEVFLRALHPDDRERSNAITQRALLPENGGLYENEYRTIGLTDGKLRWVRSKGKISFDKEGRPVRMAGITQDITARKNAEEALKASEDRYQNFIRQSTEGIWRFELAEPVSISLPADEQIKLFYERSFLAECNDAMAQMYGYEKAEELIGTPLGKFLPPDDDTRQYLDLFVRSGYRVQDAESKEIDRHGNTKYFMNNLVGIIEEGKITRAWGTQRDISSEKAAEQKLKESESRFRNLANQLEVLVNERTKELQRSNEDLQQFAHVASHDLKEPVRKIMTFSNRLKEELEGAKSEKADKYISKIESSAARMYTMIDGVLLYSSLNALEQTAEIIDLEELMESIESDLELLINEKNANIVYKDLPSITASAILIYQLFYNLINNSLKFSRPNQPLIIQVKQGNVTEKEIAEAGLNTMKRYVKIMVEDNGIGFNNEEAANIFGAFTRLHSKDKYEGTGLGLALCKKITERHGGVIYADGKENESAIFYIILPE